jgi:hypothetical protein
LVSNAACIFNPVPQAEKLPNKWAGEQELAEVMKNTFHPSLMCAHAGLLNSLIISFQMATVSRLIQINFCSSSTIRISHMGGTPKWSGSSGSDDALPLARDDWH